MPINFEALNLEELNPVIKKKGIGGFFLGITKSGTISVYKQFFDDENVKDYEYISLMADKTNNVIAVKFYKEKPDGKDVIKVNKAKDKSNAWMYTGPVLEQYGFVLSDLQGKYAPTPHEISEKGKLYFINLNEKIQKKSSK